ncbi:MAG: HDOD domain-containing protein [Rhodoferax sp.]
MASVLIGILVLVIAVGVYLSLRSKPSRPVPTPAATPELPRTPPKALAATASAPATTARPPLARARQYRLPDALKVFQFVRASELEAATREGIAARLRTVPRPPKALHKLVSAEFLAHASSADLSEIVMGEPEVAAKVLAVVNSPLYSLQNPVGNIGQAVTFLGMNKVRGICLQYMLDDSFRASSPEMQKVYQVLWNESALACELCFKLAQLLKFEDTGTLVTQIVLSYLGRLATYALMDPQDVFDIATKGLLERSMVEQQKLGLASAEIGGLLMQDWELPPSIINGVKEIDSVLVTPVDQTSTSRRTRLALCYLCSRLAEGLATQGIRELASFDIAAQEDAEYFHLHAYMDVGEMVRVADLIRMPDITSSIQHMVETMQA